MKKNVHIFAFILLLATALPASSYAAENPDSPVDPGNLWTLAKAGDATAQYDLGVDYATGFDVPVDNVQAAIWIRKAADQGSPVAQFRLGQMYLAGQGVQQSNEEAYFWQVLATKANVGEYGALSDHTARSLTGEQIAHARKRAQLWKPAPVVQAATSPSRFNPASQPSG